MENTEQMMEFLYQHRAPSLPPDALADVFDRLIWCLDANGGALMDVIEAWLVSGERGRAEIALSMQTVFPFRELEEMERAFAAIVSKWPDLEPRCAAVLSRRASSGDAQQR